MKQLDLFENKPVKKVEVLMLTQPRLFFLPSHDHFDTAHVVEKSLLRGISLLDPSPGSRWGLDQKEVAAITIFVLALFFSAQPPSQPKQVLGVATSAEASTAPIQEGYPLVEGNPPALLQEGRPLIVPIPQSIHVPVLMYHHVGALKANANGLDISLTVSSWDFEEQVKFIKLAGFESVTLEQMYKALSEGASLPAKPIAFTFDDGYEDVFLNAVPILQKYGFVGSFAVCPQLLGGGKYATWDQVLQAFNTGMEIVSHTMNHIDLTNRKYSEEDLQTELLGSKLFLESRLDTAVDIFVYPYGKYDQRAMTAVQKAGYKMAFTTEFGTNITLTRALDNPRVRVHGQNGLESFKRIVAQ